MKIFERLADKIAQTMRPTPTEGGRLSPNLNDYQNVDQFVDAHIRSAMWSDEVLAFTAANEIELTNNEEVSQLLNYWWAKWYNAPKPGVVTDPLEIRAAIRTIIENNSFKLELGVPVRVSRPDLDPYVVIAQYIYFRHFGYSVVGGAGKYVPLTELNAIIINKLKG